MDGLPSCDNAKLRFEIEVFAKSASFLTGRHHTQRPIFLLFFEVASWPIPFCKLDQCSITHLKNKARRCGWAAKL